MSTDKRIGLWSGPRNISTALMYSFAQRSDTKVFDEPLYGYYLDQHPEARTYHPGAEDILNSMDRSGSQVVKMMMEDHGKAVVFFKNMTHHLLGLERRFMKNMVNIILTRNPVEMLPSYGEVISSPSIDDVGYALHIELLNYFEENSIEFTVLDSRKVLEDPKGTLTRLCERIEIPFNEKMLSWKAGKRPEDGIWAEYWYSHVHKSTGFAPYQAKAQSFPDRLKPLLEECMPHYERLMRLSL